MKADIIVGIPSYKESGNIAFVSKQVDKGLLKFFPNKKCLIVNVDNDSPDGTKEAFLGAETITHKIYISTPRGVKGKGRNFHNLFKLSEKVGAKKVMVVDADLKSITPEWVNCFLSPLGKQKMDFVFPYYNRHPYDGTITNHICYPLIYGLLGKDIRQPIGGDFSFSSKLERYWMKKRWNEQIRNYGIDIFMTLNAILGNFKIGRADLGAKIHKPSAPKLDLMFSQVVYTIFKILLDNKKAWQKKMKKPSAIRPSSRAGIKIKSIPPAPAGINPNAIKKTSSLLFEKNKKILKKQLRKETYQKLEEMYKNGKIFINGELWAEIVYELLERFGKTRCNPELIEALKPLYFGRIFSFLKETRGIPFKETEQLIKKQAMTFFKKRSYFL